MSLKHHFFYEISQNIFEDEDLTEDSTEAALIIGLKTPTGLLNRFLHRLSKLAAANAKLHENEGQRSVEVYISRSGPSYQFRLELDTELQEFLRRMECSLAAIAKHGSDHTQEEAKEDLWDAILMYAYLNIDHVVQSLQRSFANHRVTFEEFVTRMFGINDQDEHGSQLDRELGDLLISLNHAVQSYDKSMKQLHSLVHFASTITKTVLHLQPRMKYLLQKAKFADELHDLIITLGFPERAYSTFVRAAMTSLSFSKITFHLPTTPSSPPSQKRVSLADSIAIKSTKPSTTPPKSALKSSTTSTTPTIPSPATNKVVPKTPTLSPPRPQRPVPQQPRKTSGQTASSANPSISLSTQKTDIFTGIEPYLSKEDRAVGLLRSQSAAKKDTAQLTGTVLRGNLLSMLTNAWYTFGFVTTRNENEERVLGGLYAAILMEAKDPQSIFREIVQAVETNTIVKLINIKEYGHILKQLPSSLETFLSTPSEQRSTVWHLKQFVNDDCNTEPPACLQRDYGFKYCRPRDEVQLLKDIYWKMLKTIDPMDLHNACVHGRLYEFASIRGFAIPKDRRFMQNDYGAPCVGFDNGDGLAAYRGSFYKRRL